MKTKAGGTRAPVPSAVSATDPKHGAHSRMRDIAQQLWRNARSVLTLVHFGGNTPPNASCHIGEEVTDHDDPETTRSPTNPFHQSSLSPNCAGPRRAAKIRFACHDSILSAFDRCPRSKSGAQRQRSSQRCPARV